MKKKSNAGRKKGSTKIVMNEDQYKQLEAMSGLGLNLVQIGSVLGISARTIQRMRDNDPRISDAMESGKAKAIMKVSRTAYDLASSGKQPDMTRFYLRCRAGWTEKVQIDSNVKQEITFATKIGADGVIKVAAEDKDDLLLDDMHDSADDSGS